MRAKQLRQGVVIGGLLLVIFWLSSLIWGLAGKAQVAITEADNTKRQYQTLEERKKSLEANLAALATERGEDAAMRATLGVARPGEEVIVVVPPTATTSTSSPSWWQRVMGWLTRD